MKERFRFLLLSASQLKVTSPPWSQALLNSFIFQNKTKIFLSPPPSFYNTSIPQIKPIFSFLIWVLCYVCVCVLCRCVCVCVCVCVCSVRMCMCGMCQCVCVRVCLCCVYVQFLPPPPNQYKINGHVLSQNLYCGLRRPVLLEWFCVRNAKTSLTARYICIMFPMHLHCLCIILRVKEIKSLLLNTFM